MAGQACFCASVGPSNARVNQSRTWGVKADSGSWLMAAPQGYETRGCPQPDVAAPVADACPMALARVRADITCGSARPPAGVRDPLTRNARGEQPPAKSPRARARHGGGVDGAGDSTRLVCEDRQRGQAHLHGDD